MERERLSIHNVIDKAIQQEDLIKRFPLLKISVNLPSDLPKIQANPALLEKAFVNLLRYSISAHGQDALLITGGVDVQGSLSVAITGNLAANEISHEFSVLNESSVFLRELSSGSSPGPITEKLMGLFLSKLIIEFYGGKVDATSSAEAGFIVHLNGVV
jgi:signal transduction histidine kinase